jgi:prophage regulatory protein
VIPTKRFITKQTMLSMVPISARTIDAMEKRGDFPKRFALSARKVVWDEADIEAWMVARKAADLQASMPGRPRG